MSTLTTIDLSNTPTGFSSSKPTHYNPVALVLLSSLIPSLSQGLTPGVVQQQDRICDTLRPTDPAVTRTLIQANLEDGMQVMDRVRESNLSPFGTDIAKFHEVMDPQLDSNSGLGKG